MLLLKLKKSSMSEKKEKQASKPKQRKRTQAKSQKPPRAKTAQKSMPKPQPRPKSGLGMLTEEERHAMIRDYLESGESKLAIWIKWTGQDNERGHLLRLMRQMGYLEDPIHAQIASDKPNAPGKQGIPPHVYERRDRIAGLLAQLRAANQKIEQLQQAILQAEQKFGIEIKTEIEAAEE